MATKARKKKAPKEKAVRKARAPKAAAGERAPRQRKAKAVPAPAPAGDGLSRVEKIRAASQSQWAAAKAAGFTTLAAYKASLQPQTQE